MESITIAKTAFEYSVMPVQRYEFTCGSCFMVRPVTEHSTYHGGGSGSYDSCIHCEPRRILQNR